MKRIIIVCAFLLSIFGLMQLLRPEDPSNSPAKDLAGVPEEINKILRQSCYDCHSSQTNLEWYDKLTPVNYFVYNHIEKGRKVLNFSKWDSFAAPIQTANFFYSLNKILEGEMPLSSYTSVHPEAALTDSSKKSLKSYLLTRIPPLPADLRDTIPNHRNTSVPLPVKLSPSPNKVQPSPNGIPYISDYWNWNIMSVSDRFDNGTLRIIYGNEVAIRAIQQKKINPWPDGAILAKVAWKAVTRADGSIIPGQFWQVEFMIKDSKKYSREKGWGWARWRGNDLKPYGEKGIFTRECQSCHKPMKNNDYVFTRPFSLNHDIKTLSKK